MRRLQADVRLSVRDCRVGAPAGPRGCHGDETTRLVAAAVAAGPALRAVIRCLDPTRPQQCSRSRRLPGPSVAWAPRASFLAHDIHDEADAGFDRACADILAFDRDF